MRLVKELRQQRVRVTIESPDDLWALRSVILPGDTVSGQTERKLKLGSGRDDKVTTVRKRMRLGITVEKVEYSDAGALRVLGTIVDGPEDVPRGEHHSFVLDEGSVLSITKTSWPHYVLRKLENVRKEPPLLVMLFDREEAKLYSVTRQGVAELARLKGAVAKKGQEQQTRNFYQELVAELEQRREQFAHIICGAPAFWREYLEKALPDNLKKQTVFTTISGVDRTAIRELLDRPEVKRLVAESSAMRELATVERVMEALGHEKLAYGIEEVEKVVAEGNVREVVATESYLQKTREDGTVERVEKVLELSESLRADVHILASEEAMGKLDPLGGIVSVHRW